MAHGPRDLKALYKRMREVSGYLREDAAALGALVRARESNPRHADFQGVRSLSAEICRERLDTFQQGLTVRSMLATPARPLQCGVQVLLRY
jgi:hypothetical protein